ncbi:hypothetical protein PIB30_012322 [Stylosanthes scabra]|uniref:A-kinase anchor protein 7-like phosphoesterase domain-containing protein n=1 Tax=Stylosanthes scabra TaxID=79078 RepID=A0ABU6Y389_9FABA|nr:hypothetical protein [Stylosanthes scabra]
MELLAQGSTQQKIEEELGVKITIPTSKQDDFVINSPNVGYSHFISIPLAMYPDLIDKLSNFKDSVLGIEDACTNEDEETSENKQVDQFSKGNADVAVGLVSYESKASKSSTSSENDANRSLKLHATVMNARFRKSKTWTKTVYPFDARGIFKQYGSEEWGNI